MSCRQANELAIGVMFRLCAALLGAHWQPYSVNFTHQPPDNLQLHRRLFGCNLEFGSEFNGIVCPRRQPRHDQPPCRPGHGPLCPELPRLAAGSRRPFDAVRGAQGHLPVVADGARHHRADRPDPGHERAHPATPSQRRRLRLQRPDQRRAPRPGAALPGQPELLVGPDRRHARLLHGELLHPLVHHPVRHAAGGVAQRAKTTQGAR